MPKSQRTSQKVVPGLGQHYASPKKAAPRRPTFIRPLGHEFKKQRLTDELNKLLGKPGPDTFVPTAPESHTDALETDATPDSDTDALDNFAAMDIDPSAPCASPPPPKKSKGDSNTTVMKLYTSWASLLPTLVDPLLQYERQSISKPLVSPSRILRDCVSIPAECELKTFNILCLFQDHFRTMEVQGCKCQTIPQRLVSHGLFPTSPSQPRMAVSIDLLNFFHTLFEESCDAVHAMSHALKKYYLRRGYVLTSKQTGDEVKEPFRRSLGYAMQWHDTLRLLVDRRVQTAVNTMVDKARTSAISMRLEMHNASSEVLSQEPVINSGSNQPPPLRPGDRCARTLQTRCPACFGGDRFGVPFTEGGDIHVAVDGNFHHRHRRTAGDSARFHKPEYFLSKEQVDKVGAHIAKVRKSKPKETHPIVPNEAIDQCKQSHDAANDNKAKSNEEQFDDHGISALVCRHGAPLFIANIDTPGEQQKYAVALIQHLFQHIPNNSTVLVLYDVGCVLNRSLELYDILPPDITMRLAFTTSAMHAYAHQWSCQLVYNPRLREGVGLTDGECVERLWSRLRKLIGITRTSGRSRRIWLVDRQLHSIGSSHREDLGDWLTRRYTFAQKESVANKIVIRNTGFSTKDLSHEWGLQRKAQLSAQAHAPMRLKQELDSILTLQSELDSLDTTIEATKKALSKGTTPLASRLLPELSITGERLRTQADQIYDTLNVQNRFPELKQCSLEFVRILLVLRDLKINIRKRAIGSFFEWDKLDQAVGGRQQSIGTKLHQRTRNAITKRRPALLTAINKFNTLCGTLKKLHDPAWLVPLPKPLPTQLSALRDAQELMEDVWITPSESTVPRWLENIDIRNGIRAMQKVDRCTEEVTRLRREAANMCHWFAAEATAVRQALAVPRNNNISLRLEQYLTSIERLEARWTCSLIGRKHLREMLEQSKVNVPQPTSPSNRATCSTSIDFLSEADDDKDYEPLADEACFLEPEAIILSDLLDDAEVSDDSLEPDGKPIKVATRIRGTEHDSDTTFVPAKNIKLSALALTDGYQNWDKPTHGSLATINWVLPNNMSIDHNTLPLLRSVTYANTLPSKDSPRAVGRLSMYPDSIRLLQNPMAWLDDVCINACASLLQDFFSVPQLPSSEAATSCAIFSTHDLVRLRENTPDEYFWRQVNATQYWKKTTWIIPVHRPSPESHWVLCIARPHSHVLLLFDSFGQRGSWTRDVEDVMRLISRLVLMANKHQEPCRVITEGWTAKPTCVRPIQMNGYDCGVWVLAAIAAALQGYHAPGIAEAQVKLFRHELYRAVMAQPIYIPRSQRH